MSSTVMTIKYKDCLKDNDYETFFDGTKIYDNLIIEGGFISNRFNLAQLNPLLQAVYIRFSNSEIAYDTKEIFKHKFIQKLLNILNNFCYKQRMLEKVYNLTDDDLETVNSTLAQIANNPTELNTDGLTSPLTFFDQQTGTKTRENKLNAYIKAFTLMRNDIIEDFLNEIKPLFYTVLIPTNYII